MKLSFSFFLFIILTSLHSYSQEEKNKLDLIINEITNGKTPLKNIRIADSILYTLKSTPNHNIYKIKAHHIKGISFFILQKADSAQAEFKKALNFFNQNRVLITQLPKKYTSLALGISHYEKSKGNYYNAFSILSNTLKNLDTFNINNKSRILSSLADLNLLMNYKSKAKKNALKVLKTPNTTKLTQNLNYITLGKIYLTSNLDSSLYFYQKASLFFKKNNLPTFFANNTSIAEVFIKKGKLNKAKKMLLNAENYQQKHDNVIFLGKTYLLLSEIAFHEKNTSQELKYLTKAGSYLINDNYKFDIEILYKRFTNFYKRKGNFNKTRKYQIKAQQIKDSIHNRDNIFLAKELESKYMNLAKEDEIKKQKVHIQKQNSRNKILFIALILILVLLVFTILLYRKKLHTQKQLSKEKLKTLLESQKVKTMQSHLNGQNKERKRIAKDLHDSISGNIAAIKIKLTNINSSDTSEIKKIIANIDDTYNEVRIISHNLLPKENINFTTNINELINLYKSNDLKIEFDSYPEKEINKISQIISSEVYKIIQELITNVIKHAEATKTMINTTLHENYLNILVEDNGLGFDLNKSKKGIGLNNITSRVTKLNGNLEIDSTLKKGTTININIPVK
ncbi:ATP-binding protein [uncultured Tenacibaculum sp.]|uniref:sensor histidine kinase n=1 Tax=uncultured Tenacibaculum sp. TaxID=174713 RepID=UPI00260A635B|nr:ATP-binding protein [uncultured Tenacibaculum sp.]